jgi:hypothetical protein
MDNERKNGNGIEMEAEILFEKDVDAEVQINLKNYQTVQVDTRG